MYGVLDGLLQLTRTQDRKFSLTAHNQEGSGDTPAFRGSTSTIQHLVSLGHKQALEGSRKAPSSTWTSD